MLYFYAARTMQGSAVRGSVEARDAGTALAGLRSRALTVTDLDAASSARGAIASLLTMRSASPAALAGVFRSLAVLLTAGVSVRRSLDVTLAQCRDANLREALRGVAGDVEGGLDFSDALLARPRAFPRIFASMLRAGELGGSLDLALERVASVLEHDRALRKRIAVALAYPCVVATAACALLTFLVTEIVPMFGQLYEQMHVALPPITAALIAAGAFLRAPSTWLIAVPLMPAAALAAALALRSPRGAASLERLIFGLPLIGVIRQKSVLARFARILGTLIASGVPMATGLEAAAEVVAGTPYARVLTGWGAALAQGAGISEAIDAAGCFDPLFVQLIHAGEEAGTLDAMLLRIADYYDLDVETALATLNALLEPAMTAILGGAVGFIVAAVYIPLYSLIGNIR